jgi:catalase
VSIAVIRSQQRNAQNFFVDWESTFELMANVPESMHAGIMFWSDHGTHKAWRFNHGYGWMSHFQMARNLYHRKANSRVNDEGEIHYINCHFLAEHGQKQFTHEEAVRMCGEDPDYSKRDLLYAIESGDYPTWNAKYQIMTPEEAAAVDFDLFDVTKVWQRGMLPQITLMLGEFPMHELGKLVLNKNPDDYHRDVEQAAFSPGSMVPGIESVS